MAIYPALFGHVELPDTVSTRRDPTGLKAIGVRVVRPVDSYTDHRRQGLRRRP